MSFTSLDLSHTVRYYVSWFELLNEEEASEEQEQLKKYFDKQERKKERKLKRQQNKFNMPEIAEETESEGSDDFKPKQK